MNWGEWGTCSVTCGPGQRSREGCSKSLKRGQTCPPGHVKNEAEECSIVPCGKLSKMTSMIQNNHCLEHVQGTMVRELNKQWITFQDSKLTQFSKLNRIMMSDHPSSEVRPVVRRQV